MGTCVRGWRKGLRWSSCSTVPKFKKHRTDALGFPPPDGGCEAVREQLEERERALPNRGRIEESVGFAGFRAFQTRSNRRVVTLGPDCPSSRTRHRGSLCDVYVVDLRHWLDEHGQLAPNARLGPFMAAIVESATAAVENGLTVNPCRKSTARSGCPGCVAIWRRQDVIEWACNVCLDAGVISGWQGTTWDLRDVDLPVAPSDVLVFFPIAELSTLRRLSMPASARAIMATPPFFRPGVVGLPLTVDEARRLSVLMHAQLTDVRGAQKAALERSIGRIEQAVMFAEQVNATEQRRRHGDKVH